MRGFKSLLWGAGLFCAVQCGTASAATVQTFDAPDGIGVGETEVIGIDDFGRVYGNGYPYGAFVRSPDGNFTKIQVPGAVATAVTVVALNGDVGGRYRIDKHRFGYFIRKANGTISKIRFGDAAVWLLGIDAKIGLFGAYSSGIPGDTTFHGFIRANDGTITTFDIPDGYRPASGISGAGAIAGFFCKNWPCRGAGFIRDKTGVINKFKIPHSQMDWLTAIDRSGGVAGWAHKDGDNHGFGFFRDSAGVITPFDTGCRYFVQVDALNSQGVAAGSCESSTGYYQAFSQVNGKDTVFDFPDATNIPIHVTGVSKTGVVVGSYYGVYYGVSGEHGFIATP